MKQFTFNQIKEVAKLLIKMYGNTINQGIVKHSINHLLSEHKELTLSTGDLKIIQIKVWQQIKKQLRSNDTKPLTNKP